MTMSCSQFVELVTDYLEGRLARFDLPQSQMPTAWYNALPDLPTPMQPPLHPATNEPVGPDDLAPLFPMELIRQADVVLCLGTRLNPFSTLPGYGLDYWPKTAKIIQVDINPDRIGLTKKVTVGIVGDAKKVAEGILSRLSASAGDAGREDRKALISTTKSRWAQQLSSMDHEDDDPGTSWNERARKAKPDWMSPRMAWRAIQSALPKEAIISSDIGNNCAIGNAYPTFDAPRKYLAPGLFGFYLLLLMGPQGPVGQLTQALGLGRLPFSFAGLVVASVLYSMPFVVQPLQQAGASHVFGHMRELRWPA